MGSDVEGKCMRAIWQGSIERIAKATTAPKIIFAG
jgi:hypothetical protein